MNEKHLLHILEEQASIHFTGRVNILNSDKSLFGFISLFEGFLVAAQKRGKISSEFLYTFAFNDLENVDQFSYIVEPEIITENQCVFKLAFSDFKKKLADEYSEYQKIKKLRPPSEVALVPKVDFIEKKAPISPELFDLLAVISEYSLVSDIFFHTPFSPVKTIKFLVMLRKMGAISVYSASNS